MLRRLYDWVIAKAGTPQATWALALVSFIESSFFPIPPDVMLVPMCLANRRRAFFYAAVCTLASVIGGFLGYAIGYYLWEAIGSWVIQSYGLGAKFDEFQKAFVEYGWWIIVIKGMTPIPYKLITIASGVAHFPLLAFTVASVLSRGMRFFLVAGLLYFFGEPIRAFIEKYLTLLTTGFAVLLVGGFVALRYL
ncbi:cytochrome B561 [Elstera litoralis]|uniref:Cytochrome B561 n=1 Tax=Elstera litoralis TaxID=552518 RepID=A0A0F3IPM1_9PROT|nr:YqaA family protein [Elstera litoralis]KJV08680.1 cytochrome B561 [Elstera litoralis]